MGVTYRLLILTFAFVLLTTAGASAASHQMRGTNLTPNWYQQTATDNDRELAQIKTLGMDLVRVSVPVQYLMPQRKRYDSGFVKQMDQLFVQVEKHGLRAVVVIGGTPCWNSTKVVADPCATGWQNTDVAIHPPRQPEVFTEAVTYVVSRGRKRVSGVEVWNEPNHDVFWKGTVEQYVSLAHLTYRAMKAAYRDVPVLGGSVALGDADWLRRAYAAGIKGAFDALAMHPYDVRFSGEQPGFGDPTATWTGADTISSFRSGTEAVRAAMVDNGDGDKPIWLTEFGSATCPGVPYCVTDEMQGYWLYKSFEQAAAFPYVQAALSYRHRDPRARTTSWEDRFGIANGDHTPKPALAYVDTTTDYLRDLEVKGQIGPFLSVGGATVVAARVAGPRTVEAGLPPAVDARIRRRLALMRRSPRALVPRTSRRRQTIDSTARRIAVPHHQVLAPAR